MTSRVYNFSPGPAILPLAVLEEAQASLLNYKGTGMSVMEHSHRSKVIADILEETVSNCKELLGIPEDYKVLFLQGGASHQFAMIPLNFLREGERGGYIVTGSFAEKAFKEAKNIGEVYIAASGKEDKFRGIPTEGDISIQDNTAYLHLTSNNTIYGTQWNTFPYQKESFLVADMSSDIMSRPLDVENFHLIYAGAQKNLGPSGVTLVIISPEMLSQVNEKLPKIFKYTTHAESGSLYNTPPTYNIYIMGLVLKWLKNEGGLQAIEKYNKEKAGLIYRVIDDYSSFYFGHANKKDRSFMNITFRLPSEELEKEFIKKASSQGLEGLKGHRSVGGIRASVYNAMPREGCKALADFMKEFYDNH